MDEFKVGDQVVVKDTSIHIKPYHCFRVGDKLTIIGIDGSTSLRAKDEEGQAQWISKEAIKPVEPEYFDKAETKKEHDISSTLEDREKTYGDFMTHAHVTQRIKGAMHASKNWHELDVDMKEALEMTAHKIGRILNGDPRYKDSWHDIVGYIKLVDDRL